jgi:hypothetical protein
MDINILYLMILINISYFVGSFKTPLHSSPFIRTGTGRLFYSFSIISLIFLTIYIPYKLHWWYVILEFFAFIVVVSNGNDFIVKYPFLFGPTLTIINFFMIIYYFLN